MSMPSINLKCEKCDFEGSSMSAWGNFNYVDGDSEYGIKRTLGWCNNCKKLVAIEDFRDTVEILNKINEVIPRLKLNIIQRLFLLFNKKYRDYDVESLTTCADRLRIIDLRKGSEKCLVCGSMDVKEFDGDYQLKSGGMLYEGEKRTGFMHPGCGGEIIATPCDVRLFIRYTPKYYSLDGLKIEN